MAAKMTITFIGIIIIGLIIYFAFYTGKKEAIAPTTNSATVQQEERSININASTTIELE
jgi:uncharacterized membrane-anchored protein YitT (DUF2179 family)